MRSTSIMMLLLVALAAVSAQTQYVWNATVPCAVNPGCYFDDVANWEGGVVPPADAIVTITIGPESATCLIVIRAQTFVGDMIVNGPVQISIIALDQVALTLDGSLHMGMGSSIIMQSSVLYINNTFSFTGSSITAHADSEIYVIGTGQMDDTSILTLYDNSIANFGGNVVFSAQLELIGENTFFSAGVNSGSTTNFSGGINSNGTVVLGGIVTLGGSTPSQINTLKIVPQSGSTIVQLSILSGAHLVVTSILSASTGSQITVNSGGSLEVKGDPILGTTPSTVAIYYLTVDQAGTALFSGLTETGSSVTIQQINGKGVVTFDSCINANVIGISNGNTFAELAVSGSQSKPLFLNIGNSMITRLESVMPYGIISPVWAININITTNSTSISDVGNSYPTLNNTYITVAEGAELIIDTPLEFAGGALVVLGTVEINANIYTAYSGQDSGRVPSTIKVYGPNAMLSTDNITIVGDITVTNGDFAPTATILNGTYTQDGGMLILSWVQQPLFIYGDFNLEGAATVQLDDNLEPDTIALVYASGSSNIAGALQIIQPVSVVQDQPYNILEADNGIIGMFSQVTVQDNSGVISPTLQYELALSNPANYLTLTFSEPNNNGHNGKNGKMAGWKVFLIVLTVLVVIAGAGFGYYSFVRNKGYLAIQ
eukprot:gene13825-16297_t